MLEQSPGGPGPGKLAPTLCIWLCSLTLVVPITCHRLHVRRVKDYGKRNLRVGETAALHAPALAAGPFPGHVLP